MGFINMHFLKSCSGIFGLVSLSMGVEWVDICDSSSGKKCCASDDTGMGNASARHRCWTKDQCRIWISSAEPRSRTQDLQCLNPREKMTVSLNTSLTNLRTALLNSMQLV